MDEQTQESPEIEAPVVEEAPVETPGSDVVVAPEEAPQEESTA